MDRGRLVIKRGKSPYTLRITVGKKDRMNLMGNVPAPEKDWIRHDCHIQIQEQVHMKKNQIKILKFKWILMIYRIRFWDVYIWDIT